VLLDQIWLQLSATPGDEKLLRRMVMLANLQIALGSKLRLTVQSVLRGDKAAVWERSEPTSDPLFAGRAAWRAQRKPDGELDS